MRTRPRKNVSRRNVWAESLEPRLLLAADFTLALLPDTQFYSESLPGVFHSQTQWIADNTQTENIAFVSHVGDVVENAGSLSEWQNADAAMDRLDGIVPYSVLPGNHDYSPENTHGTATGFVSNFGAARYAGKSWYGGSSPDQLNHFQFFSGGGHSFLHLALEWEPRPEAVSWAQSILDANPRTLTIVSTHAYLDAAGGRFSGTVSPDGMDGEQLFQSLVSANPQIFLVMGGHFSGENHQVSTNSVGLPVLEMVADYQNRLNGGDGWLQLLRFRPDFDTIEVSTYSPTLDQFETDSNSRFSFSIDLDQRLNHSALPGVSLSSPLDNGPADSDPSAGAAAVHLPLAAIGFQLTDTFPGIDDATVVTTAVRVTRDGYLLTESVDYRLTYNADNDQLTATPMIGRFPDGDYQFLFNAGGFGIADMAGNPMPATTLSVAVDYASLRAPDSLYFTVNSAMTLNGGLSIDNEDIVLFDGADFTLFFDGSDVGLTAMTIDAMTIMNPSEILLSFTTAGTLPGIFESVDDSDIVRFTAVQLGEATVGTFSLYFDGSDVGLTTSDEDINALSVLPDGQLILSTLGPVSVNGVGGNVVSGLGEDLLAFTPTSLGSSTAGTWAMYLDGSSLTGFAGANIDGASVYANGDLYLTVRDSFSLPGLSGRDEDVFIFRPTALGESTSGVFVSPLFFDGSRYGLSSYDVCGIYVPVSIVANTPPVAKADGVSVNEGSSVTIDVLADNGNGADTDSDGSLVPATTTIVGSATHGSLVNHGDGTITWTPDPEFVGVDSFTYTVRDNDGVSSNVAVVTITVSSPVSPSFYFTLDSSHTFASGLSVANEDVISWDGSEFGMVFDGSDVGLASLKLNSLAVLTPTEILMSLTSSAVISGISRTVLPSDIVKFTASQWGATTVGTFELYFAGANVGLDLSTESIDGLSVLSDGRLIISTNGSFSVPGASGNDEDLIAFTPTTLGPATAGSWQFYLDGSDVEWSGQDVDAVALDHAGKIYVSGENDFTPGIGPVADDDVMVLTPASLGSNTSGSWNPILFFDGSQYALESRDITGIDITASGPLALSTTASGSGDQARLSPMLAIEQGTLLQVAEDPQDVQSFNRKRQFTPQSPVVDSKGTGGLWRRLPANFDASELPGLDAFWSRSVPFQEPIARAADDRPSTQQTRRPGLRRVYDMVQPENRGNGWK